MEVVYKNTGERVVNEIWREFYCVVCRMPKTWGNIRLEREIMEDAAGGTEYICSCCVDNGAAKKYIEKHFKNHKK